MLSFDFESSLCGHELTTPMQAQVDRYMKEEDVKEIPRVENQVVTEVEFERSDDAKEIPRVEKQVVTEDETESDEEWELMRRWNNLKGTG
jgi:hypothetical protein